MKGFLLFLFSVIFFSEFCLAQTDTIFAKGNQQILCNKVKETNEEYKFTYINANNEKAKSRILKYLVDSIKYFTPVFDTSSKSKKLKRKKVKTVEAVDQNEAAEKPWKKTMAIGVNLGNVLEFNNPSGTDVKNISFTTSLDLGLNYRKPGKKLEMTNELHYLFGFQKANLSSGAHLQRIQDDLNTLHDLSLGLGKTNKWNFNLIVRTATSLFIIYDGDYFKNYTTLGKIKSFASPYDITVSPGLKYQPTQSFRISLSPYSFNMYGVKNNEVSTKGIFITDLDASGNFKNFLFKRLGAEVNFWFDKSIKQWLEMQYRLSFSSDYFEKIGKNGKMDGLFITKVRIFKDIYFTHRANIKSDLAVNFLKPYYSQTILLSYAKSF
jgi:hypothetical protein